VTIVGSCIKSIKITSRYKKVCIKHVPRLQFVSNSYKVWVVGLSTTNNIGGEISDIFPQEIKAKFLLFFLNYLGNVMENMIGRSDGLVFKCYIPLLNYRTANSGFLF
jgi:hypothetical protein